MKSKVTTPPAQEPITLTELKASLRVTSTAQDTFLTQIITDAREMVERYTSRKLITQTLTGYASPYCDNDDDQWWEGYRRAHMRVLNRSLSHIELDHGPVQSVASINTIDTDNAESLYASTNYYLANYDDDRMPRIHFNLNASVPSSLRYENNWKIVYLAGYGNDPSDVPSDIRRALTMLAGYLWAKRGACGDDGSCVAGCGASAMLDRYRLRYGLS